MPVELRDDPEDKNTNLLLVAHPKRNEEQVVEIKFVNWRTVNGQ